MVLWLRTTAGLVVIGTLLSQASACLKTGSSSNDPAVQVTNAGGPSISVTGVKPVVGKPGDVMTISGSNLNPSVSTLIQFSTATAPVTVASSESGTFIFPEGLGLGLKEATAKAATTEVGRFSLVANLTTNSLPIIISDASQVCSDVTYINAAGDQTSGTRDCSGGFASGADPYNIRKGKTVAGVAGKLIPNCQNRVNSAIFDMSGGTNMRVARVKKITDAGVFTLGSFGNVPRPAISNDTMVKPIGKSHPLKDSSQVPLSPAFKVSTTIRTMDINGNIVGTGLGSNEMALMLPDGYTTIVLSEMACDEITDQANPISTNCFDVTLQDDGIKDVWDTIDDLNGEISLASPIAVPDSSPYEAFPGALCGYVAGGGIPSGAVISWKDNTLSTSNGASTCVETSANCALKDLSTGLTWFKGTSVSQSWYESVYYCSTLALNGKSWRLPTQKELMTGYVDTIRNTIGSGTVQNYNVSWWSSTTDSTDANKGWQTNLATGATASILKSNAATAMCVRDAD